MALYMMARFSVSPEAVDVCEAAISEFIRYIKENEPDTNFYISLKEGKRSTDYLHVFSFKDDAARDKHRTSPGVKRFTDILYPTLTSNGVEFKEYESVATTGP